MLTFCFNKININTIHIDLYNYIIAHVKFKSSCEATTNKTNKMFIITLLNM